MGDDDVPFKFRLRLFSLAVILEGVSKRSAIRAIVTGGGPGSLRSQRGDPHAAENLGLAFDEQQPVRVRGRLGWLPGSIRPARHHTDGLFVHRRRIDEPGFYGAASRNIDRQVTHTEQLFLE